jgi:hypothetical protein
VLAEVAEPGSVFKKVDYDVSGLLHYIEIGDIGLPDIQRPFVWSASKVRDLFDSMYRGFPVGYLLFWETANPNGAKTIGVGSKGHAPDRLIVDGQQRLTSLYAVLRGRPVIDDNYRQIRIEIAFRPADGRFDVADAAIKRDPEYIADISTLWASGKSSRTLINQFLEGLTTKRDVTEDEEERISRNIDRLFDLQKYPFTALEILSSVSEEQVADIFVRINSEGVKLNQADFILTLMSVFWDEGRADLERFCYQARQPSTGGPSPYNHFLQPQPDQLLRASIASGFRRARLEAVYSVLRGKDVETGRFSAQRREEQFEVLRRAQTNVLNVGTWHEYWKAVIRAGFRDGSVISSQTNLVYTYALYLIGQHDYHIDPYRLRELIARWLFMTSLTGRYSGSSETVMEADLARLRGLSAPDEFDAVLREQVKSTLTDDFWSITLPNDLVTAGARSPYVLSYYASLSLLNARVLFSKLRVSELFDPALKSTRAALERHHLFPKNYLNRIGVKALVDQNQVANLALVEWPDNSDISDDPPYKYWPPMAERYLSTSGSADDLAQMCRWHALPDGWEHMNYPDFLQARRRAMAQIIREGFEQLAA